MKRFATSLAAVLLFSAARADFVIQQKMEGSAQNGQMTIRVKGDKIRADLSGGTLGDVSTIMNANTGDSVMLMHKQKLAVKISGAQMRNMMEAVKKQFTLGATNAVTAPKDTGRSETIGGYNAEIYDWSGANGVHETLWVAKEYPNYKEINAQLAKVKKSPLADRFQGMGPDTTALPGMVVKSQVNMMGQVVTTSLVSVKEETVAPSEFEMPADYHEMTQPTPTPEMEQKQKEREQKDSQIQSSLTNGAAFPDFAEKDLNGKPFAVGNFKGKTVLVDFWATWCGPCVAEFPNVLKTYQEYHSKGFEILSISLDEDRSRLESFIKQKQVPWQQYFDGKGWDNKLAQKYGIESIPATFLLNGEGRIIGKDLRGEELENAVAKATATQ